MNREIKKIGYVPELGKTAYEVNIVELEKEKEKELQRAKKANESMDRMHILMDRMLELLKQKD